jgi:WhiB family redox-sensing transcriptional regulator
MSVNVEWMEQGLCREVSGDMWFPESVGVAGQREAQAAIEICRACPVVLQCREYGNRFSRGYGIWGGVSRAARPSRVREIDHGTEAGAKMHHRRGEPPCLSCRNAATLANALRKDRRRSA